MIFLYFCGISCYLLISNFVYLSSFSLSSFEPGQRFVKFVYLKKKNKLLVLLICSIVFELYFIYLLSDFIISFFLLTLDFVCPFSNSFRW